MTETYIKTERQNRVVIVTLNRPHALNALNSALCTELLDTLRPLDKDPNVGCIIITGSGPSFAAGADIKEMASKSFDSIGQEDYFADWELLTRLRTPKIAAVQGYALGGGCELAMMCDIIYAADTARFGLPEISLGVIPGIGGTQRLPRLIGRTKAMEMILTGRPLIAAEAERAGLVSRVLPAEQLMEAAIATGEKIASFSKPAVMAARECVNQANNMPLAEGLLLERRAFHARFAFQDQKEGMTAFLEKRQPNFRGN